MKKFTAAVLVLAMCFSLIACNKESNKKEKKHRDHDRESEVSEVTEETTSETSETTSEPTETTIVSAESFEYIPYYYTYSSENNKGPKDENGWSTQLILSFKHLAIGDNSYPALAEAVNADRQARYDSAVSYYNSILPAFETENNYGSVYVNTTVYRSDSIAFSYHGYEDYGYNGNYTNNEFSLNFNSLSGNVITLEDVIVDKDALKSILSSYIATSSSAPELVSNWQEKLNTSIDHGTLDFVLIPDGIQVFLNRSDYAIDNGYLSVSSFKIPYTQNEYVFNSEYFSIVAPNYCLYADSNNAITYDINGDGSLDTIEVQSINNEEYNMFDSLVLSVNGDSIAVEDYGFDFSFCVVHVNGCNFVYITCQQENDYDHNSVFQINDDGIAEVGQFGGSIYRIINPELFEYAARMDPLSTMTGYSSCYINYDGTLAINGTYYLRTATTLESKVELEGDIVDANGNYSGESRTIAAGSNFGFFRTDNQTYVDFIIYNPESGAAEIVRFDVDLGWSDGQLIEGMRALDCFVYLFYAG